MDYSRLAGRMMYLTRTNGGATLDTDGAEIEYVHGYVVGGSAGITVTIPVEAGPHIYEKALNALVAVHNPTVKLYGSWVHEQHVYIDAVDWYADYTDAVKEARERGEIAIWDVARATEVTV